MSLLCWGMRIRFCRLMRRRSTNLNEWIVFLCCRGSDLLLKKQGFDSSICADSFALQSTSSTLLLGLSAKNTTRFKALRFFSRTVVAVYLLLLRCIELDYYRRLQDGITSTPLDRNKPLLWTKREATNARNRTNISIPRSCSARSITRYVYFCYGFYTCCWTDSSSIILVCWEMKYAIRCARSCCTIAPLLLFRDQPFS